jgi:hypothetical protein
VKLDQKQKYLYSKLGGGGENSSTLSSFLCKRQKYSSRFKNILIFLLNLQLNFMDVYYWLFNFTLRFDQRYNYYVESSKNQLIFIMFWASKVYELTLNLVISDSFDILMESNNIPNRFTAVSYSDRVIRVNAFEFYAGSQYTSEFFCDIVLCPT